MAFSVSGKVRIRTLYVNGVATTIDVTAFYSEAETSADPGNVSTTTNGVLGTRMTPTRTKVEWSLTFPWVDSQVAQIQSVVTPGNVISFEVCPNPTAAPANQIFSVVDQTTVGKRTDPKKVDDVTRLTIVGEGGDFYPEQVGRAGFPGVFAGN